MANQLIGADSVTGELPEPVRERLAAEVADTGTEIGASLSATIDSRTASIVPASTVNLDRLPGALTGNKSFSVPAFAQDNLTTFNGVQYGVWVNSAFDPIVGKRTLPHGEWETFDLSTLAGNPLATPTDADGHNNYAIAVDDDGHIHISGNHHDDPLHYVRSTNPLDISAWTAPAMVGTEEDSVSYPQFFINPTTKTLFFLYRNGASGGGRTYLNKYDTATETWTRVAYLFNGIVGGSTASAYTNHVAVANNGDMHLFYLWRDTYDVVTSHDICFIKSTDDGATWTDVDGVAQTLPLTVDTSPVVRPFEWAVEKFINQTGADVDSQGRPHAAWWVEDTSGKMTLTHLWHDGTTWQEDNRGDYGDHSDDDNPPRPSVLCHGSRTFALYRLGDRSEIFLQDITPASNKLATISLFKGYLGSWEPSFDTRALNERGELHMIVLPVQRYNAGNATVNPDPAFSSMIGWVLSVNLAEVVGLAVTRKAERTDTGWRTLPVITAGTIIDPAAPGEIRVRRQGTTVRCRLVNVTLAAGTGHGNIAPNGLPTGFKFNSGTIFDVPQGFSGSPSTAGTLHKIAVADNDIVWRGAETVAGAYSQTHPSGSAAVINGEMSWDTDDGWPPVLPGVPTA